MADPLPAAAGSSLASMGRRRLDDLLDVLDLHAVDARAAALDEPSRFALGLGELGGD